MQEKCNYHHNELAPIEFNSSAGILPFMVVNMVENRKVKL